MHLASDWDEDTVVHGLEELWRRRTIREQGLGAYDFSHDKIRDVAYAEMSQARRSLCHRRAAQALEVLHATDLDPVCALIAAHYERAGLAEQAISYYRLAAEVAQHLYANEDALGYAAKGLALLKSLPDITRHAQQELRLLIIRGNVLAALEGHAAPEVGIGLWPGARIGRACGDHPPALPGPDGAARVSFCAGRAPESVRDKPGAPGPAAAPGCQQPCDTVPARVTQSVPTIVGQCVPVMFTQCVPG